MAKYQPPSKLVADEHKTDVLLEAAVLSKKVAHMDFLDGVDAAPVASRIVVEPVPMQGWMDGFNKRGPIGVRRLGTFVSVRSCGLRDGPASTEYVWCPSGNLGSSELFGFTPLARRAKIVLIQTNRSVRALAYSIRIDFHTCHNIAKRRNRRLQCIHSSIACPRRIEAVD
jgi:hypothetical protein